MSPTQNSSSDSSTSSGSSTAASGKSVSVKGKGKSGSKSQGRQRDRSGSDSRSSSSGSKPVQRDPSFAEYNCGPCLDKIMCKRQALLLSEKDLEVLKNGPMIYK